MGGGVSKDASRWVACKPRFFLHVRVLSRLFRRLFIDGLMALHRAGELDVFGDLIGLSEPQAFATYLAPLWKKEWGVPSRCLHANNCQAAYAKPPFGRPEAVLAYLSRYTHPIARKGIAQQCPERGVAISNSRLISADADTVAFQWKDYRVKSGERRSVIRLSTIEFIRRFLIHVLPDGFHRIHHSGVLASSRRKINIAKVRIVLGAEIDK
jgi:hypothetical protein